MKNLFVYLILSIKVIVRVSLNAQRPMTEFLRGRSKLQRVSEGLINLEWHNCINKSWKLFESYKI